MSLRNKQVVFLEEGKRLQVPCPECIGIESNDFPACGEVPAKTGAGGRDGNKMAGVPDEIKKSGVKIDIAHVLITISGKPSCKGRPNSVAG